MRKGARKRHAYRLCGIKSRLVSAAHHGEQTVLGAALATRNGRIHKMQAQVFGGAKQLARHAGRGGGVVHKSGARLHAGKSAIGAQGDTAQVFVVAHAAKHKISLLCGQPRRGRLLGLQRVGRLCAPGAGLGRRAVVNRDLVAGACQVQGHGVTHDTQA